MTIRLKTFISLAISAFASPALAQMPEGDAEAGEKVVKRCLACHALTAEAGPKVGPTLYGIIGRQTGSVEGYAYSTPMKAWGEEGHIWTPEEIDAFLEAPKVRLPGNKMTFAGIRKPQERADLLAYLATLTE